MSQANHTFKRLQEISGGDAHLLIDKLYIVATIATPASNKGHSRGYLFLPPAVDFLTNANFFRWPECPWFWTLDPTGRDRLSAEDARGQGFPAVHMHMTFRGKSWDTSVYKALRTFHNFQGFGPDSQELGIHLGQPLFELSGEREQSFAHVCEVQVQADDELSGDPSQGMALNESAHLGEASHASAVPETGMFNLLLLLP
ncbi:hypothetical protein FB45DRAFT_902041 [Roridomyces roridus]|uniref:Uncharacterized protein n=1 Tax=Roridomyces roridus TaxID=1738132 RepID=A0AAD7FTU3_9AGAR|nr:hypothetical protein FB45DRAFT_902041 [Roridomyces roridus]